MLLTGDAIDVLRTLEDGSVHCCVTSPPYWGLRDYGVVEWEGGDPSCDHSAARRVGNVPSGSSTLHGGKGPRPGEKYSCASSYGYTHTCDACGAKRKDRQLGLEESPSLYVAKLVDVFSEVWRVLRDDGTLWLNLGDTYNPGSSTNSQGGVSSIQPNNPGSFYVPRPVNTGLKPKNLVGIPWRVAFALQEKGWILRSDIIWAKPNPMPESVTDRPTKSHEYIFLLAKSARYYYDGEAIKEPWSDKREYDILRANEGNYSYKGKHAGGYSGKVTGQPVGNPAGGRNKRTVWTVATRPFKGAHFATFPEKLIEPCILAGCPAEVCGECGAPWKRITEYVHKPESAVGPKAQEKRKMGLHTAFSGYKDGDIGPLKRTVGFEPTCSCGSHSVPGTVLDPFAGSGTTGVVAYKNGREFIGIDINPEYIEMAEKRIAPYRDQMRLEVGT